MTPPHPLDRRSFLRLSAAGSALCLWPRGGLESGAVPTHHAPRARRLLYLHMMGAPSQLELFDWKPALQRWHGKDLPDSVRQGQRITTMTSGQSRLRLAAPRVRFAQRGSTGAWISDHLPHLAAAADELAIVRSLHTEAINHEPAVNFTATGSEQPGRPCLGSWLSWALGSEGRDLPSFVVLHARWSGPKQDQALYHRLWGAGFLPGRHQGVLLRSEGDPVLFVQEPDGVSAATRRLQLDAARALDAAAGARYGDSDAATWSAQQELAFRMERSVPELVGTDGEPAAVRAAYGPAVDEPGSFAHSALLARRLLERGVRAVQIWHRGWDQHKDIVQDLPSQCRDVDQPCAALLADLRRRGMLDDTLVVWMQEFGRAAYAQGDVDGKGWGRDHHPRCFSIWCAGGGVRAGQQIGATDELGYNVVADPVHVHDLNATILHLFGYDHERLTVRWQGRDMRLTDVAGRVVQPLLA